MRIERCSLVIIFLIARQIDHQWDESPEQSVTKFEVIYYLHDTFRNPGTFASDKQNTENSSYYQSSQDIFHLCCTCREHFFGDIFEKIPEKNRYIVIIISDINLKLTKMI